MRSESCDIAVAARLVALSIVMSLAVGCASTPEVGVRKSYRKSRVDAASVVPFFALSEFSLDRKRLDRRLAWAETAAVEWLRNQRLSVTGPRQTRQALRAGGLWSTLGEDGVLRRDLARSFESSRQDQQEATQRELVRRLWSDRHVTSRFVLFGEILYQTAGECGTRADSYTRRAIVMVAKDASESMPRPCIVTHFQARLVDASTGSTVWYNRRLRELHVSSIDDKQVRRNVEEVVRATLGGTGGLRKLIGRQERDASGE